MTCNVLFDKRKLVCNETIVSNFTCFISFSEFDPQFLIPIVITLLNLSCLIDYCKNFTKPYIRNAANITN